MKNETALQYKNVSPDLKGLWNVQLDLLAKFANVCKKNDLQWFVDAGTLLGAVRHHGFIPWDDDVDVIMPYDDYNKLCSLADEFKEPYFLQTWKSQDGWRPFMSKLRRSDTTGCTSRELAYPNSWNKGIFIDIFAMSYIPENRLVAGTQLILLKIIRALYFGYEGKRDGVAAADNKWVDKILRGSYTIFGTVCGHKSLAKLYNKIGGWQKKPSRSCGLIMFRPYSKGLVWDSDWYKDTVMLDFMDLSVPCPADYDSRLSCAYGDYMTPVKAPSFHGSIFFDAKHSYREGTGHLKDSLGD